MGEILTDKDFAEKVILLNLAKSYDSENPPTKFELYEITRGYWRVNFDNVKDIEYALAVAGGEILEVYKIAAWFPAETTLRSVETPSENVENRLEFVGKIAPEKIRDKYIGKKVETQQNPVRMIKK